jgi:uncharacterized protein YaiI (UPF0178 family)
MNSDVGSSVDCDACPIRATIMQSIPAIILDGVARNRNIERGNIDTVGVVIYRYVVGDAAVATSG